MRKPDVKELLEAGVHFGHRTEKWNPKMKPFIFEARNGIYVIDLNKTAEQMEAAGQFLMNTAKKGGKILFVGCKKQSQEAVKEFAIKSRSFYVNERWLGGTLTNLKTIRKSVERMRRIDDMEKNGKFKEMPKQEVAALRREALKLHRNLDGLKDMETPPDVMFLVDVAREQIAVSEAHRLKIPIVAITDTNSDPTSVDYPIPANDDAIRSIRVILEYISESISEGLSVSTKDKDKDKDARSTKAELEAVSA